MAFLCGFLYVYPSWCLFYMDFYMCIPLDGFYGFSISQILMARGLLDEQSDIVGTYSIEAET